MDDSPRKESLLAKLMPGLLAGLLALAGLYFITYKNIEIPKKEVDLQKLDLEIFKLSQTLQPVVDSTCTSDRMETNAWKISCHLVNNGQYPIIVTMLGAEIHQPEDRFGLPIRSTQGGSLSIRIPNWKGRLANTSSSIVVPVGESGRDFVYFASFVSTEYSERGLHPDVIVKTAFEYRTIDSPVKYLRAKLPDADEMLSTLSRSTLPAVISAAAIR